MTETGKPGGDSLRKRKALGRGLEALLPSAPSAPTSTVESPASAAPISANRGEGSISYIDVEKIKPNPHQPRARFEEESLLRLAQSIKSRGLLQPLLVTRDSDGYTLVAGERRLRAAKLAGLSEVPCIVSEVPEGDRLTLALIENVQREDLNPMDLAEGLKALRDTNLTQQETADKIGLSRSAVANTLRLLELPRQVQDFVRSGELSSGAARALLALPEAAAVELAQKAVDYELSVRQVENAVRAMQATEAAGKKLRETAFGETGGAFEKRMRPMLDSLEKRLGTKVTLKPLKEGGTITVRYYSDDDLNRLLDLFGVSDNPI
ncbi:MAG: ParB/RepB/Spo0J family partition protein [bacterium]|jgi:ParB family chromosome partitioning protein